MECSICFNPIVDKVLMTCSTQHAFCFKCLLGIIEANSELKGCPNCRGGDKFIMLTTEANSSGFYSLDYFRKSLPILQKILGDNVIANTCLVSELILVCYVKNKKQLNIAHKLISSDDTGRGLKEVIEDIVPYIKWDEKKSIENIGLEMIGGLAEFLGMPPHTHEPQPPPNTRPSEQRRRRTNTDGERPSREQRPSPEQRERTPRIIFSTPSSFLQGAFPFPFLPNSE